MNYAIKDKQSNRCVAIVDTSLVSWFKQNLPIYDIVEIGNIGSSTFTINEGIINTISIFPIGKHFSKDAYHIINKFPEAINLGEAYNRIKN